MVQLRIPTTVVDTWWYWEFEEYIKLLNEKIKEEEKRQKEEEKQHRTNTPNANQFNPSRLMSNFNTNSFKAPKF